MFDTNFPEAFSEEYAEFEEACKEASDSEIAHDVADFETMVALGADEFCAFRFAVSRR